VKVDAILRCPVFETGETRVYDIDNIVSSYYDCSDSDSESESVSETETVFDVDQDDQDDHDHDHDHDHETGEEQETEPGTIECDEFEVIQETSK
jgi:ABC-type Zn2+ transport system substrate-binding protein/surface adhesin